MGPESFKNDTEQAPTQENVLDDAPSSQDRPEEPVHMLGIETPGIADFEHLIGLKQKYIDDIMNVPRNKYGERIDNKTLIDIADPVNKLKAEIKELKQKALEEVDFLIEKENKTIDSLKSLGEITTDPKFIQEAEAKKAEYEKMRDKFL